MHSIWEFWWRADILGFKSDLGNKSREKHSATNARSILSKRILQVCQKIQKTIWEGRRTYDVTIDTGRRNNRQSDVTIDTVGSLYRVVFEFYQIFKRGSTSNVIIQIVKLKVIQDIVFKSNKNKNNKSDAIYWKPVNPVHYFQRITLIYVQNFQTTPLVT